MSIFQVAVPSSGYDEFDRPLGDTVHMAEAHTFNIGPVANGRGGQGPLHLLNEAGELIGLFPRFSYVLKMPAQGPVQE